MLAVPPSRSRSSQRRPRSSPFRTPVRRESRYLQEVQLMVHSALLEAFDDVLRPLGFRKKSGSWYRISGDLYGLVGVQKSSWDESYYVNVGFAPAGKVKEGWLPESKCLVRFRVDAITSISRKGLELLSVEGEEVARSDELRSSLVEEIVVPVALLVDPIGSLGDLKSLLRSGVSGRVFIHHEIREKMFSGE
ncbi:DUF4304 domain-containing protein [Streptomyces sp. NPDC094034]|uniref:DUF4304 domain-containing protein n=1 Tax=Streptomyces sp. NPDC094034 TaxID=3155309 RepID=UPI003317497C